MSGRIKAGVVGGLGRVFRAVGVAVFRAIVIVSELSRCGHTEESGRAVERIGCRRSQGDAGRNVCEERGYEGGVGSVFEECVVGRIRVGGLGVLDYRKEGGVELAEEIDDEGGVSSAIDNIVLAAEHHVKVCYENSELA